MKNYIRNKKGITLLLFALLIPIIIGYGAYVSDLGQAYSMQSRVKGAVDAGALAGISQLNDVSDLTDAKTTALTYINNNLSATIPGFSPLTLSSSNLTIEGGIYDTSNQTFTPDEVSSTVNAIKITLSHTFQNNLATYFMINSSTVQGVSIAAKTNAGGMPPGTGFPLIIMSADFCGDLAGNTITLSPGDSGNGWWTAFDDMGGTAEVIDILWYWQYGNGTAPTGLSVGEEFKKHNGSDSSVWMNVDAVALEGMEYIFPIGTDTGGNMIRVDGFVGATVDDVDTSSEEATITIIDNYINNANGGTLVESGANTSAITGGCAEDLLTDAFQLVQ